MAPSVDRNLLFGILALQMDFITREQLIGGMQAWVLAKDRPLAEHLSKAGALRVEHRRLLEPLVEAHIHQHGNDPQQSLAAVSLAGMTPEQLVQLNDRQLQASLGLVGRKVEPAPIADPLMTLPVTPGSEPGHGSRFRVLRPHAQGGLGRVLVASDEELHREVALKEIRPEFSNDTECRARFTQEAEVTGNLEHPGIGPVYSLGSHPDGSPFYAMRFIKGDSLQTAIERFHADHNDALRDRGRQALELRKLLSRFIDVCQAIEYAHSRNVIHRDLKPSNIMLGKYGETLVVDWGLAKVKDRSEPVFRLDTEAAVRPSSGSRVEPTLMGSKVGTLGYMSPEQALGRHDLVDRASDVFSLGATLYHLLTGESPLMGVTGNELLRMAQVAEIRPPRKINKDIPPPLEAICLKAIAKEPADRYPSASALVDDLEHWLADEPVSARREPIHERLARLVRRYRTGLLAGIAALLLISIASTVATVIVNNARQRAVAAQEQERQSKEQERQAKEQAEQAREQERHSKEQEQVARRDAEEAKQLAEKRLAQVQQGSDILAGVFRDLDPRSEEKGAPSLSEALGERLTKAADEVEEEAVGDPQMVAKLQVVLGHSLVGLGYSKKAVETLTKAHATRAALLGADDLDTLTSLDDLGTALVSADEATQALPVLEECLARRRAVLGADNRATLSTLNNLAIGYRSVDNLEKAIELQKLCLLRQQAALGDDDSDTLDTLNNLATSYVYNGQASKALPLFTQLWEKSKTQRGEDHYRTLELLSNLAAAYRATRDSRDLQQAAVYHKECLDRRRAKWGESHPATIESLNNLATTYADRRQFGEALPMFERVCELSRARNGEDHAATLKFLSNRATANKAAGRLDEAVRLNELCLQLRQIRLGESHRDTLMSMNNLAEAFRASKQLDKAIPLHEQCLAQRRLVLGDDHPYTLDSLLNLALSYEAEDSFDRALPLWEERFQRRERTLGVDNPATLTALRNWMAGLARAGRHSEASEQLVELISRLERQTVEKGARLWKAVHDTGIELSQKSDDYFVAERCLREALAKSEIWKPTEADRRRALLGIAECRLLTGNLGSAAMDYESIVADAAPKTDDAVLRRASLGFAAALAASGKFEAAEQVMAVRLAEMTQSAPAITSAERRNLLAIFGLLVSAFYDAGKIEQATHWQNQFDQWKAALPLQPEPTESRNAASDGPAHP